MRRRRIQLAWAIVLVAAAPAAAEAGTPFMIRASSFLGGAGDDDSVRGARIQSDGTIVLAANLGRGAAGKLGAAAAAGAGEGGGYLLRIGADGRRVLSVRRVADELRDLALDAKDNLYVAAAEAGALKLDAKAERVLWTKELGEPCDRVDAAPDGHCVTLARRSIAVFAPDGTRVGTAKGRAFTNDVCIDAKSGTVIFAGFRNARAHDGRRSNPVQISYLQAVGYDGKDKWCNYDWSAKRDSPRFINRPTNNMADTRGYRCAIGRDGKLYCAFESAGGNHIFRYHPRDITRKVKIVGGGKYHQFYASGAEHKSVFIKFEPATGAYVQAQQFCGRRDNGKATNVRNKNADLCADAGGRLYFAGYGEPNLPIRPDPCPPGEPLGGPFLLALSADFSKRLICTRMQAKGWAHCVDARRVRRRLIIVYAGSGATQGMVTKNAVQPKAAGKDGFFVVLEPVEPRY